MGTAAARRSAVAAGSKRDPVRSMDERRVRNHARDRRAVLAVMPSVMSWEPAITTADIVNAVRLPQTVVLHLLHELDVEGLAAEAGGHWRRRGELPPPPGYPTSG